jgi:hypothetical protein
MFPSATNSAALAFFNTLGTWGAFKTYVTNLYGFARGPSTQEGFYTQRTGSRYCGKTSKGAKKTQEGFTKGAEGFTKGAEGFTKGAEGFTTSAYDAARQAYQQQSQARQKTGRMAAHGKQRLKGCVARGSKNVRH